MSMNTNSRGHRRSSGRRPSRKAVWNNGSKPLLAVFGSSRARPGDDLYEEGYHLGKLLGRSGFNVATGGYTGVMEAVSRGAHDSGAYVVGVTMKRFEDLVNPFVMDEISTPNFYERFTWLIDRAHGYIAMRGGMGTLSEMTFAWQKLWLKMLPARPFILLGAAWQRVLKNWLENLIVEPSDYDCFKVADSPEQACAMIRDFFARERRSPSAAAPH